METTINYDIVLKNTKTKLFNNIPIIIYIILFLFTAFLEIVSVDFDVNVIVKASFWFKLATKYVVIILSLLVMFPYFRSHLLETDDNKKIKEKATKINDELSKRRLTTKYKQYTKEKMIKEERDFFLETLNDCGNIDSKYLDREWTIKKLRKEKKLDKINKYQLKVLIDIKKGKITFYKLNGTEIRYVSAYKTSKNKKYQDQQAIIVSSEVLWKFIFLFAFGIVIEILLDSLINQEAYLKYGILETLLKIFTVALNFATACFFSLTTARKSVEEEIRFTEVVVEFTNEFLENQDDNYIYEPTTTQETTWKLWRTRTI